VAIFLATIGSRLEDGVSQLMSKRQILKATILDAVGSEAAEKTACYIEDRVRELASSNGAEITLRYSPGYCDWDITQQRVLFEAMDSAPLGVELTEECLMVPRKSVSGIIGVGRFESKILRFSPCRFCTKRDCPSRR
jgi:cobalamin-dependent methionine synthase I